MMFGEPWMIGNGKCDGSFFNTKACEWNGGDCADFNANYSNSKKDYPENSPFCTERGLWIG